MTFRGIISMVVAFGLKPNFLMQLGLRTLFSHIRIVHCRLLGRVMLRFFMLYRRNVSRRGLGHR
jgi:hypothetical protein